MSGTVSFGLSIGSDRPPWSIPSFLSPCLIPLSWDLDQSGKTSPDELRGALRSLNMRMSAAQAQEVAR